MRVRASRVINAKGETVFQTVADIRNLSHALPQIKSYELLTDGALGVGTRFREVREMRGREMMTQLEITEFAPNEFVRMIADNPDTVWDSTFAIVQMRESSQLTIVMHARSKTMKAKLRNALIKWMIKWAIEKDLDSIKSYCESTG